MRVAVNWSTSHCDFISARLISVAPLPAEDEDVDVARERRRVHEGWAQDDLLRVCDLTKVMTLGVSSSVALIA